MSTVRPKVYRAMKKDADDKPTVDQTATGLGVRTGTDINTDSTGNVVLDGNGMSVAPGWRNLELHRIPKRLGTLVPGARGSNSTHCFTTGGEPFQRPPSPKDWNSFQIPLSTPPLHQLQRSLSHFMRLT